MANIDTSTLYIDGSTDKSINPKEVKLYICDLKGNELVYLSTAINKQAKLRSSSTHELDFDLPFFIDGNILNSEINQVLGDFRIKLVYNNWTLSFIISQITNQLSDDGLEMKHVVCFSMSYTLGNSVITNYNVDAYTIREMCNGKPFESTGILYDIDYSLGYISPELQTKYRSVSISNQSVFEAITTVAKSFNAILVFDDENKLIHFYDDKDEKINIDRGLILNANNYITGLQESIFFDEVKTQLLVSGKDSLTIDTVTSTGSSTIEDISFYMTGFMQDNNGNVTSHSIYGMSDILCKAELKYKQLLSQNQGLMDNLVSNQSNILNIIDMKQAELSNIGADIANLENQIIALNNSNKSTSLLVQQKDLKTSQYNAKQNEINLLQQQVLDVKSKIKTLQNELSLENNFTPQLLQERKHYIKTEQYSNENYSDPALLYQDALDHFQEVKKPRISYEVNVVDFLASISEKRNWDKLYLNDIVTIIYPLFNLEIKARIVEIDINFDENTIQLTISNVKDIINNFQKLIDTIYNSASSSASIDNIQVQMRNVNDDVTTFKNILASLATNNGVDITCGNGSVFIKKSNGITSINPTNSNEIMQIVNGNLYYSTSGEANLSAIDFSQFINSTNGNEISSNNKNDSLSHFVYAKDGSGYYSIVDNSGRLNVQLGSSNGVEANQTGGQITLYNNSQLKERVYLGIDDKNDYGKVLLYDTNNINRISINSSDINSQSYIILNNKNSQPSMNLQEQEIRFYKNNYKDDRFDSYLNLIEGKIAGQFIATQNWVGSQNYLTQSSLTGYATTSDLSSLESSIQSWVTSNFQLKS